MSKHRGLTFFPPIAKGRGFALPAKCLSACVILILLTASVTLGVEDPDEHYLRVYSLIQKADSLSVQGDFGPAQSKYQQALKELLNFKKHNPIWNSKVVALRLEYLRARIVAMAKSNAPAPTVVIEPKAKPATTTATSPARQQVKLLDAGAEPRRLLRLNPKPGDKQNVVMTMKIGMGMDTGSTGGEVMKTPAIQMALDATVKGVSADGDITYELALSDVSLVDEAGVDPQLVQGMKDSIGSIQGLSSSGTMSNRGLNQGIKTRSPRGTNARARQPMEELKESLALVVCPLPEEPVGPGAKWEAKLSLNSQGMTINQTVNYELLSIEGDRLNLTNSIVLGGPRQKTQALAMTGRGTGEVQLDLGQLLPLRATMKNHSEIAMGMSAPGEKEAMTMKMEMEVSLEAK